MTRSAPARASSERVQLLGLVGAVGVHLADHVVAALERPREAGQVGRPEAALGVAVQHVHARVVVAGQGVGDGAGAVG